MTADIRAAYRNPHGGFGHALEPDVRAPASEPASTAARPQLHALEVLAEIDGCNDPMAADGAAWIATIADHDGGVPFVLASAADSPCYVDGAFGRRFVLHPCGLCTAVGDKLAGAMASAGHRLVLGQARRGRPA